MKRRQQFEQGLNAFARRAFELSKKGSRIQTAQISYIQRPTDISSPPPYRFQL